MEGACGASYFESPGPARTLNFIFLTTGFWEPTSFCAHVALTHLPTHLPAAYLPSYLPTYLPIHLPIYVDYETGEIANEQSASSINVFSSFFLFFFFYVSPPKMILAGLIST